MALVQRNFQLPAEQAEWLKAVASERRIKQAELVRYALEATRADIEGRPRPLLPGTQRIDIRSLGGSMAGGPDSLALLLEDRRREEGRDARRERRP